MQRKDWCETDGSGDVRIGSENWALKAETPHSKFERGVTGL